MKETEGIAKGWPHQASTKPAPQGVLGAPLAVVIFALHESPCLRSLFRSLIGPSSPRERHRDVDVMGLVEQKELEPLRNVHGTEG